jgi:hypothetical protein
MLKDRQGMERIQFTDNATKGLVCRILGCSFEHGIGTTKTNTKVSLRACTRCSMPVGGEWNDITGFEWNE